MRNPTDKKKLSRFWKWYKWVGFILIGLFVLAFLLLGPWSWWAGRRLQARLDVYSAAGEPADLAGLAPHLPPENENAYSLLRQAYEIAARRSETERQIYHCSRDITFPLADDERQVLRTFIEERKEALPLLTAAATRPVCVPEVRLAALAYPSAGLDPFVGIRDAAHIVMWQARLDWDQGHQLAAFDLMELLDPIERSVITYPTALGYFVGFGIDTARAQLLIDMTPDLRVGHSGQSIPPDRLRKVIEHLLDERQLQDDAVRVLSYERILGIERLETIINNSLGQGGPFLIQKIKSGFGSYVIRPIIRENQIHFADGMTKAMDVVKTSDWPTAQAQWKALTEPYAESRSPLNIWGLIFLSTMDRVIGAGYRMRTERRLAATALACRWYALDHDGQWPAGLDVLVPSYLPAVPLDLMAVNAPLRYDVQKAIIYSVGINGIDDGGDSLIPDQDMTVSLKRPSGVAR